MKFISKSSNLLIVLRPGMPASHITGTPAKPTVSVRFKDGVAEVPDDNQEIIKMMLAHPGFNGDFISAEGVPTDPYAGGRQPSEPTHVMTEMKFGTPTARKVEGSKMAQLSPELRKAVEDAALEMAKSMLPGMLEQTLKTLVSQDTAKKAEKAEEAASVNEDEDIDIPAEIVSEPADVRPKEKASKTKGSSVSTTKKPATAETE